MTSLALLGRTGLRVGRLGLGASYRAPTKAYEKAFERGVNYFYWGTFRRLEMAEAIRRLAPKHRESLVVVVQSYQRLGFGLRRSVERALRQLGLEYADVLLLGWHNRPPSRRVMDAAARLKDRGLIHHVALSGHRRTLFPELLAETSIGAWHVRYNAVHRGAEREVFPALSGLDPTERPGLVTYTTTRWGHLCDPSKTPEGEPTPRGTDCYRFAMSRPEVNVVLAGPASETQMDEALEALELGALDDEQLKWMRRVGDHIYRADRTTKVRDGV